MAARKVSDQVEAEIQPAMTWINGAAETQTDSEAAQWSANEVDTRKSVFIRAIRGIHWAR